MPEEFFRQPTDSEQRQFKLIPTVIQKETAQQVLKNRLHKKEVEYAEKHKPYCSRCAKLDFKDRMNEKIREYERKVGHIDFEKFKIKIQDLEPYGAESRFNFIEESKAMEPVPGTLQNQGQIVRQVQIGVHKDYKCKERGCGISVFVPMEDLEPTEIPIKTKGKK